MTRTIVKPLPHDLAVIAQLKMLGRPVGFAEAPDGALAAVQARTGPDYMILYPLSSGRDGTLEDPYADADFVYQVTCVGRLASGVRWLVGEIEDRLLGVAVAGRAVVEVVVEDDRAVRPDNDLDPAVFIATPRIRLVSTPA